MEPHAPQFAESLLVSMHAVPQSDRKEGQTQLDPRQYSSARQALPHVPQFAESETGVHTPPQTRPLSHTHVPKSQ